MSFVFIFSLGKTMAENSDSASLLKMNVLRLDEDKKLSEYIDDKITFKNVSTFYQLAKLNKLSNLAETYFSYIERCFSMVAETQNFLELEFNLIGKILESPELSVHSELEVLNAANNWLKHNIEDRSKFAKQLLLTVRLPLFADHALKNVLTYSDNTSAFKENIECVDLLKEILLNKENFYKNKSSKYYTSRYCNQNKFNILIFGGRNDEHNTASDVNQIDGTDFNNVKVFSPMAKERRHSEAVSLKGNVYVFGGYDDNGDLITSIDKYSPLTKTWNEVAGS